MVVYIVDTYAWIEYLNGSKEGKHLDNMIRRNKDIFITLECCIAEFKGYCLRENIDFEESVKLIYMNSKIFSLDLDIWLEAASIKHEMRKKKKHFGIIDSLLVAKAHEVNAKIISGDPHFNNLKNVVFLA